MNPWDHVRTVLRRWPYLVIGTVLGAVVSVLVVASIRPSYTASAATFFSLSDASSAVDLAQGSTYTEKQVQSFAELAESPIVLDPVIDDLGLATTAEALAGQVSVLVPQRTVITTITAVDPDAERAADIANAVATQLTKTVDRLSPRSSKDKATIKATVISRASAPAAPSAPRPVPMIGAGVLLGLLLGAGVALLRAVLDTRIRTDDGVVTAVNRQAVAQIPHDPAASAHPLAIMDDPHSLRSESYRRLRSNLQFLRAGDHEPTVVVTSSLPGEGKTTTSVNLAATLAEAGHSVLLIDGDLRRPQIAKVLGLEGAVGLTTVLLGTVALHDATQGYGLDGLEVLTSGEVPPNPSELLQSRRMSELLSAAQESHDYVVIDSPPLLPVTDGAVLAALTGGALVVAGAGRVRHAELRAAEKALDDVNAHLFGVVLNRVKLTMRDRHRYAYSPELSTRTSSRRWRRTRGASA